MGSKVIDSPFFVFEVDGKSIELYRHPELLINNSILDWFEVYNYYEKYGCNMGIDEIHPCFVEATTQYNRILTKILKNRKDSNGTK